MTKQAHSDGKPANPYYLPFLHKIEELKKIKPYHGETEFKSEEKLKEQLG
jgi:hypothetical protein